MGRRKKVRIVGDKVIRRVHREASRNLPHTMKTYDNIMDKNAPHRVLRKTRIP